eukprot:CAMPEP_0170382628 /NCGR_PEP_ID=MMETSP0117_2-20130122/15048_1 /TAXON_ID=400756 /ORGANISM="Durinskia baltica, Strain CSIRO CS-38" /LENGTH=176 /DNA_ID=CAMNT_0010638287 /DNA_START=194 /DNA_END=724 /DNA_ORIENTATION=-
MGTLGGLIDGMDLSALFMLLRLLYVFIRPAANAGDFTNDVAAVGVDDITDVSTAGADGDTGAGATAGATAGGDGNDATGASAGSNGAGATDAASASSCAGADGLVLVGVRTDGVTTAIASGSSVNAGVASPAATTFSGVLKLLLLAIALVKIGVEISDSGGVVVDVPANSPDKTSS